MTPAATLDITLTSPPRPLAGGGDLCVTGVVAGSLAAAPTLEVNAQLNGFSVSCTLGSMDERHRRAFECHFPWAALPPGEHSVVVVAHAHHVVATARHDITDDVHPVGGMHGSLDLPAEGSVVVGDVIDVHGWCLFDHGTTSHVEVFVDDHSVGRARPYLDRADLAAVSPHRDAPVAGFHLKVPLRALPLSDRAEVDVRVEAVSTDGRRWRSGSRAAVRPAVGDHQRDQADYAALLRRRTEQLMAGRSATGRPTVAVVTHDLGYGGGQLWLSEMLRQFQEAAAFDTQVFSIADGPLRSELEQTGLPVHVTAPPSVLSLRGHEDRVREFATMFAASGAQAVLVNTVIPFQAVEAAHLLGLPVVWAIHESFDLDVYCSIVWGAGIDRSVRARFADSFSHADALVFEAAQTADLFAEFSRPEQRRIVDYGVDVDAIDRYREAIDRRKSRATFGWTDDDLVLVVVGVFEGRKAQAAVVAAFDELADVHPHLHLALVGAHESGYCQGVAAQVSRARHGDRMQLIPITPDILLWYAIADVLVCASDVESLPRSVLEAMAFELPVVSTDVFGMATLLDDGLTGWLTRSNDLRALVATLHRVVGLDPAERAAVAGRARADVVRRSGERAYGALLAATLQRLMQGDADPLRDLPPHRPTNERTPA